MAGGTFQLNPLDFVLQLLYLFLASLSVICSSSCLQPASVHQSPVTHGTRRPRPNSNSPCKPGQTRRASALRRNRQPSPPHGRWERSRTGSHQWWGPWQLAPAGASPGAGAPGDAAFPHGPPSTGVHGRQSAVEGSWLLPGGGRGERRLTVPLVGAQRAGTPLLVMGQGMGSPPTDF